MWIKHVQEIRGRRGFGSLESTRVTADRGSSVWLALRSLLWTILLPGFFAGYVPWRYFGLDRAAPDRPAAILGLLCIGLGGALLAACILEFARTGRGTLSPVDPPRRLVVRGLYRYVRNPMYLSVTAIVLGETLLIRSAALAIYWVIWFLAVNLFVIGYEEPTLHQQFGASYDEYTKQVGRWFPKLWTRGTPGSSRRLQTPEP
jgi:protein-S-isoprenylcysteine O-methyltransferase Ste14